MKKIILLVTILSVVVFSCKKDEDDVNPVISINSPAIGLQANVYDTLHVNIHITDDVELQTLTVKLVSMQMSPVLPSVIITMSGTTYDANFNYIIDNFRLPSDNYYLLVEAFDGHNTASAYSTIYVTGIPRALNGFFVATIPTPGTLTVYKCDTSGIPAIFNSGPSDFTDLAVSDYWQQVYTNGSFSGPLKAISIDGSTTGFSIPSIVGSVPYWGPMSVSSTKLWVSYRGLNQFKSLDYTGATGFSGTADNGFYPKQILQIDNRIFTEQKDISSAAVRMVVFSTAGGSLQEAPMSVDVVGMFKKDADNVFVVGNTSGLGHLLIYDYVTNGFWEPITLPAFSVTCATQIDENTLLIGMSNGTVYKFTYLPVGLLTWTNGINPTQLRYDDVNGEIYAAEGMNVNVYSLNPFSLIQTIPFSEAVSDLELWFNR